MRLSAYAQDAVPYSCAIRSPQGRRRSQEIGLISPAALARKGVGWSALVDGFRTCNERRLLILQMWIAKKYMHIPQIVERVSRMLSEDNSLDFLET